MPAMRRETVRITARVGLRLDPDRLVNTLSYVEKQMLEIARLSEFDPRVIVLDEPTAALSVKEIRVLFALIRQLQKAGIAVIYVSHYLSEIESISDRVTVLRGGKVVASYLTKDGILGVNQAAKAARDINPYVGGATPMLSRLLKHNNAPESD